ncbi:MAG: hypothetical protein QG623_192, partial [Patescibacteria group bacterium]|nr:hypothetical protein [Patescibacteria group bacterium]
IASLLELLAFGYIWVHYLSSILKANFQEDLNTRISFRISQVFVLAAIIAHPILISANLKNKGYGSPPASYEAFFGSSKEIFILLGGISLFAFLLFELKSILKKYPKFWSYVLMFNDLAMLLIIIHGFNLGLVISSTWFKYVWLIYGLSLLFFYYDNYINKKRLKKFGELFIIGLVVVMMLFITLATDLAKNTSDSFNNSTKSTESKQSTKSDTNAEVKTISRANLASANGLKGNKCYIAINSVVYDASNNSEWSNGEHTPSRGQAKCGEDLAEVIKQSPHGAGVLDKLPVVGKLGS